MLRFAVAACLCLASVAHAEACEDSDEDQPLWGAYERAWAATAWEEQRALLAKAQGAWLDYREASCEMFASREGSPDPEAYRQCRRHMAEAREFELRLVCRTGDGAEDCDAAP